MTVYIDNANTDVGGIGCFHMAADNLRELKMVARALKLPAHCRQIGSNGRVFYLINRKLRPAALALGAVPISRREMARISK